MCHAARRFFHAVFLALFLVSAPCAFAGSWSTQQMDGMSVQLYTPTTAPKLDGGRALMISLHGCAQTAAEMKAGNNWEAVADEYGMVVAVPDVPNGGVIAGCWDYFGTGHSRSNRHNDNVLSLANTLKGNSSLNIDPRQVYVSGLSSGGSEAMVLGCLAPDVFAGIGINSGPTIGTGSGQVGFIATTRSSAVSLCKQFAGNNASHLQTQVTSIVYGTSDFFVHQDYGKMNAQVFAEIYGANQKSGTVNIMTGGTETRWERNGVKILQLISVANLGHAWPAGRNTSGGGGFIDHATINYPTVLTKFLFCANRRVPGERGDCDNAGDPTMPPDPSPTLYCGTDNNAAHAAAGRAIQFGSGEWASYGAKGSFQWLGFASTQTTLKETRKDHFVTTPSCN